MKKGGGKMAKKREGITIRSSAAEYLTYVATVGDQQDSIEMRYEDENIWLTQKMMATLYDVSFAAINQHIKKVYDAGDALSGKNRIGIFGFGGGSCGAPHPYDDGGLEQASGSVFNGR